MSRSKRQLQSFHVTCHDQSGSFSLFHVTCHDQSGSFSLFHVTCHDQAAALVYNMSHVTIKAAASVYFMSHVKDLNHVIVRRSAMFWIFSWLLIRPGVYGCYLREFSRPQATTPQAKFPRTYDLCIDMIGWVKLISRRFFAKPRCCHVLVIKNLTIQKDILKEKRSLSIFTKIFIVMECPQNYSNNYLQNSPLNETDSLLGIN